MFNYDFIDKRTVKAMEDVHNQEAVMAYLADVSTNRHIEARNRELERILSTVTEMVAGKAKGLSPSSAVVFINNQQDLKRYVSELEKDFEGIWNKLNQNRNDCVVQLLSATYPLVHQQFDPTLCRLVKRLAIRLGLTQYTNFI